MTIQLIGYWKETLEDEYALPQHFEMALSRELREALVRYLRSGRVVNQTRGASPCRYGCGANGSAEQTDGVWLWPQGLVHYVEHHGLSLPAQVLDAAVNKTPSAPVLADVSRIAADNRHWLRWCAERIPAPFREALAVARIVVERSVRSRVTEEADRLSALEGLSEAICARCTRLALRDKALCAFCMFWMNGTEVQIRGEYAAHELARLTMPYSVNVAPSSRHEL